MKPKNVFIQIGLYKTLEYAYLATSKMTAQDYFLYERHPRYRDWLVFSTIPL